MSIVSSSYAVCINPQFSYMNELSEAGGQSEDNQPRRARKLATPLTTRLRHLFLLEKVQVPDGVPIIARTYGVSVSPFFLYIYK
jgi:hypothetical protein